ncbi:MAG: Sua5/YciO/YrdC/YwlC family protein, partial [Clostridium sp.]
TNCGPRYSIIKKLPYDRETTTMNNFQMCHECKCEYENPLDRRFHAQPNCCSKCGPSLILLDKNMRKIECNEIKESIEIIKQGKIICLKGLTGYNLVCLPESQSINRLRINKNRRRKPLAIMMRDIETVKKYCRVSAVEENILTSESRPIVILEKKNSSYKELSSNSSLGVILPYTPLHYMLLSEGIESFVFTSGNLNNNPIIYEDKDLGEVSRMADYFLIHNRDINIGVDDSVVRVEDDIQVIRPGRGYYPLSTKADNIESGILSVGSLLKNTLSISSNGYIFTSPYIGDIESLSGEKRLQVVYKNLKDIYGITQKTLVYDAHPFMDKIPFIRDFHGEKIRVYHHHSHIVSCMGENNYFQNVIGIAFDGLGYGEDLGLWGGEFLICSLKDFKRVGNIGEFPLVGGDAATLSPWKIGISLIHSMIDNSEEIINRIFYEKDNIKTL